MMFNFREGIFESWTSHNFSKCICFSLLFGFYFSNTLSLTFGALGVNDVIAGIVCLIVHEIITKEHYSRTPR